MVCHLTFTGLTAWYGNAPPITAGLSRGWCDLHNASPGAKYLPSRTPTSPDVTERPKRLQGQQPPEPMPVHPTTIQKMSLVQVHQSWDRVTEDVFQSQGHQTVKQPSLTQRLLPTSRLEIIGHFNNWITSHFNNATLIMFTYLELLISYLQYILYFIPSIASCLCCSGIAHPYTLLKKIKGTLKQHNVTPSQSHFCEIKLST